MCCGVVHTYVFVGLTPPTVLLYGSHCESIRCMRNRAVKCQIVLTGSELYACNACKIEWPGWFYILRRYIFLFVADRYEIKLSMAPLHQRQN
jgi:hypothetical protein